MSAALPTSSSPQDVPSASPPPEIPHDSGLDPTPTAITLSVEVIAERRPDESSTSLPPAPRPQSPVQPPDLVDSPDPAQALLSAPARPHSALTVSLTERNRSLPSIPANATLAPQREASLRPRVASDPVYGHANRRSRRSRRSEPPPAQPLDIPGSRVFRQRPATHPGEFEFQDVTPARVQSPFQGIYPHGSVGARLDPTLKEALKVRDGAKWQAKWIAYSINIAIALQICLGALTTALGASLSGHSISISIAVLGSLATLVASYLARTRGSSEPENSLLREQALNNFIRRLESFILDKGMQGGHDQVVENFRNELERLLNPSDPNAKKNRLIFDPKIKIECVESLLSFLVSSDLELDLSEEALDLNEPSAHDRGRHHTQTENIKSCHCNDVTTNSRRPKGKSKVVDSSKKGEKRKKHDGDEDLDTDLEES